MTTAVKAIYENGVFKPKEPLHLAERTEVEVLIPSVARSDDEDPTGWKTAEALIGFIQDAPPDMAEHHDEYSTAGDDLAVPDTELAVIRCGDAQRAGVRTYAKVGGCYLSRGNRGGSASSCAADRFNTSGRTGTSRI